jgi:hypothetical protein
MVKLPRPNAGRQLGRARELAENIFHGVFLQRAIDGNPSRQLKLEGSEYM